MHRLIFLNVSRGYRYISWIAVSVVLLLIAANGVAYGLMKLYPGLMVPQNIRVTLDFFSRYESSPLAAHREEWFGVDENEWPVFVNEIRERIAKGGNEYDDFTGFKPVTSSGKYLNFLPEGYRSIGTDLQGPWPIDSRFYNVFLFGGSTAMGVGSDKATIARFMQMEMNDHHLGGKREVRVYNFGRGSYFSTQEGILFEQLLRAGARPDVVLFLDGLNDFFFLDGKMSAHGVFAQALSESAKQSRQNIANVLEARPLWHKLYEFLSSVPLVNLAKRIGAKDSPNIFSQTQYRPEITDPVLLENVIKRYRHNVAIIRAVANTYGIQAYFVIQPVPGYRYDVANHIALNPNLGLGGHERSGQGYPLLVKSLKENPIPTKNLLWEADLLNDFKGAVFLDAVHYTKGFSKALAQSIVLKMRQDNMTATKP